MVVESEEDLPPGNLYAQGCVSHYLVHVEEAQVKCSRCIHLLVFLHHHSRRRSLLFIINFYTVGLVTKKHSYCILRSSSMHA